MAHGGPHTSPVGTLRPLYHCGVQGHRTGLGSSTEQAAGLAGTGQHGDNSVGIIPWDSPGAGRAPETQGHFAYVTAPRAGLPVPQFEEHHRLQDTSGSLEGPKQEVPCSPQVPTTSCPGTGSDQGLTLCPLLPRPGGLGAVLSLSPRGDSGSRDTLCARAGSLIAGGCCLSGPRAHGPGPAGDYHLPPADFQECQPVLAQTTRHNGTALAAGCGPVGTDRAGTQMTRAMHRQVTLTIRGWSHLGTCVVRGQV